MRAVSRLMVDGHIARRFEMQRKVIVIGGGLAGLTAAATAAQAGAEVTMLEARAHEGGRARTATVEGGFLFNQGAHALYAGAAGIGVLREFGIEPRGKRPPLRGYGRLRGEIALLPSTNVDALKTSLIGIRAKAQLAKVVGNPKRMLRTDMANRSMQQWIDEQVSHPDARAIIAMATRVATYCDDLGEIAADAAVPQTVGALTDGVLYLDGGWQQLVDALRVVVDRAGAKVVVGTKVTSIEITPGGVCVHTDDVAHDADAVVIATGGPDHADELLAGASATVRRWATEQVPVYASTLDLGLRALPRPERRFVIGVDDPIYLSVHTPSAALAPDGGELVHVMRYGDAGVDARPELEAFLDEAQPGWRDEVVAERFSRRLVVAHGRPTPATGNAGRPTPTVDDLSGVFVAGDWVGPDGLLADASIASGRAAARAAVARSPEVPATPTAAPSTT